MTCFFPLFLIPLPPALPPASGSSGAVHRGVFHGGAGPGGDWQVQTGTRRHREAHPESERGGGATVPLPASKPHREQHHHLETLVDLQTETNTLWRDTDRLFYTSYYDCTAIALVFPAVWVVKIKPFSFKTTFISEEYQCWLCLIKMFIFKTP